MTVAEDQEEFKTITAAVVQHAQGISHLLAFGGPMQGIIVLCGKNDAAAAFGVGVTA